MVINPFLEVSITALTAWRENRGGGELGMQTVINVIQNRAKKHKTSMYEQCVKPLQFTSMTSHSDPETTLFPQVGDAQMEEALDLADAADENRLADLTGGATMYYNPNGIVSDKTFTKPDGTVVKFPETWNPAVLVYSLTVAGHLFFKEK